MALTSLDHINIFTDDLDETVAFYEGVLGMESRPKPSGRPGAWLYVEGRAVIHVNMVDRRNSAAPANLNHAAFTATDLDATVAALDAAGVEHEAIARPALGATLVNCHDPNGIPIELVIPFDG